MPKPPLVYKFLWGVFWPIGSAFKRATWQQRKQRVFSLHNLLESSGVLRAFQSTEAHIMGYTSSLSMEREH